MVIPSLEHAASPTQISSAVTKRTLYRSPASRGITPPSKRAYGKPNLKSLIPTLPKELQLNIQPVRRTLFQLSAPQEQTQNPEKQVYREIPIYTDIEDDPEKDYKVSTHN